MIAGLHKPRIGAQTAVVTGPTGRWWVRGQGPCRAGRHPVGSAAGGPGRAVPLPAAGEGQGLLSRSLPKVTCQGALLLKDPTLREKRRGVQSGAGTGKKEDPGRSRRAQWPGRVRKQMDLCFKHLTSIRRESQVHTQLRRGRTPCRRRKPARKTRPRSPESQPERCARRAPKASLLLTN